MAQSVAMTRVALIGLSLHELRAPLRRGPRRSPAIGTALLAAGGTAWVVGERNNHDALVLPGLVTTVAGIGAIIVAGSWMAVTINCRADPDCPDGEECKEVPAPPGGIPYKQCVRRL
jgi:hypothetical protein